MNQCKRVSDCPTDRLAQCRGQAVQARCDALQGLLNKADQRIDDLTHPAPVPPAGDVEVVVYACGPANQRRYVEPSNAFLGWHIDEATPLVDRAHVTRLTAERDGLLAESKKFQDGYTQLWQERDALQAELTKARELIEELEARVTHKDKGIDFRNTLIREASELAYKDLPATWLSRASTLFAHQSAPAATGSRETVELNLKEPSFYRNKDNE